MKDTPLQLVGNSTKMAAVYKSESHKLHQSFPVKEGTAENPIIIVPGQPVVLNADGTISPFTGAAGEIYLGIAMTSSITPAYPKLPQAPEVTVAVQGFCLVYGVANAAINPGYVTVVDGTTDQSGFVKYKQSVTTDTTPKAIPSNFIALGKATAEGDLIQILVK